MTIPGSPVSMAPLPTTLATAMALLTYYFDLNESAAWIQVAALAEQYPADWIRLAVVEALYQGRYKPVSVTQILALWQRRGRVISHFNREFESITTVSLKNGLLGGGQPRVEGGGQGSPAIAPRPTQPLTAKLKLLWASPVDPVGSDNPGEIAALNLHQPNPTVFPDQGDRPEASGTEASTLISPVTGARPVATGTNHVASITSESVIAQPVAPGLVAPGLVAPGLVTSAPVAPESVAPESVTFESVMAKPLAPASVTFEPVASKSVTFESVTSESVTFEPVASEPGIESTRGESRRAESSCPESSSLASGFPQATPSSAIGANAIGANDINTSEMGTDEIGTHTLKSRSKPQDSKIPEATTQNSTVQETATQNHSRPPSDPIAPGSEPGADRHAAPETPPIPDPESLIWRTDRSHLTRSHLTRSHPTPMAPLSPIRPWTHHPAPTAIVATAVGQPRQPNPNPPDQTPPSAAIRQFSPLHDPSGFDEKLKAVAHCSQSPIPD